MPEPKPCSLCSSPTRNRTKASRLPYCMGCSQKNSVPLMSLGDLEDPAPPQEEKTIMSDSKTCSECGAPTNRIRIATHEPWCLDCARAKYENPEGVLEPVPVSPAIVKVEPESDKKPSFCSLCNWGRDLPRHEPDMGWICRSCADAYDRGRKDERGSVEAKPRELWVVFYKGHDVGWRADHTPYPTPEIAAAQLGWLVDSERAIAGRVCGIVVNIDKDGDD